MGGLHVMAWGEGGEEGLSTSSPLGQRVAIHLSLLHLLGSLPISILFISPISVFSTPI